METITDMLSTFFVTKNKQVTRQKKKITSPTIDEKQEENVQNPKREDRKTDTNLDTITKAKSDTKTDKNTNTNISKKESSMTFSESESSASEVKEWFLKKYVFRAIDMYNKNIMIVNNEQSENMAMLSDLLHTFSLMNRVDEKYNNIVYVVSTGETRDLYKTMLLENPYLYFTDFKIKQNLSKQKMKELQNKDDKRTIVIVQHSKDKDIDEYLELLNGNVQLIIIGKIIKPMLDLYKKLGDNKLLMHKKEKLKSLQKLFFDKVVRLICQCQCNFLEYFQKVNADTFGVRYIVIKNEELRYC